MSDKLIGASQGMPVLVLEAMCYFRFLSSFQEQSVQDIACYYS